MKTPSLIQSTKNALQERMISLGVDIADVEERFSRSGGPGGQNVNKVSTAVNLKHLPTNISVNAQDHRSQLMNRQLAWKRLLDAIELGREREKRIQRAAREKKRRQSAKRPRAVKERVLKTKKKRSLLKKSRNKSRDSDDGG